MSELFVKEMTGTSVGGFALISESLGMTELVEVPLIALEGQHAGPSTGMPTEPEQVTSNTYRTPAKGTLTGPSSR